MAKLDYHHLRVTEVDRLTDDAVAVSFDVPAELEETFRRLPGQHIILKTELDGREVQRSYSICSNALTGKLRVGIRRLHGGRFSNWATTELRAGDVLEVLSPIGDFTIDPNTPTGHHRCAIAAGSGITPIISLVATTLEVDPAASWTVIYGNRTARSIMFLDELHGMKDRWPTRLQLIHVLSREETVPLLSGRIDAERLEGLFATLVEPGLVDEWFLCGPQNMVETVRAVLAERDVPEAVIHDELFFSEAPGGQIMREEDTKGEVSLSFTLDGRTSSIRMGRNESVLDAALKVRSELPYSCRGGMCASCKARVVTGEVTMRKNYALVDEDLNAGFALTCQAHPATDVLVVDFDQR